MKIFSKNEIESVIDHKEFISEIERALVIHHKKQTLLSPSGFLSFENPMADVHLKAGSSIDCPYYVVKIASGFYENPKLQLPSSNGLMLLFSRKTGQLEAILLDEGRLTDVRTALAGAIAAKHMARKEISKIGIIGAGTQAKEQLFCLQFVTSCKDVVVWARDQNKALAFSKDPMLRFFNIEVGLSIDELAKQADLIVTTTPSVQPLLYGHQLRPGAHVTAVGADTKGKQELDVSVFERADYLAVDCLFQCSAYGDYSHAKDKKSVRAPLELGAIISCPINRSNDAITVADLTGIAIEDLQIAIAVYDRLK